MYGEIGLKRFSKRNKNILKFKYSIKIFLTTEPKLKIIVMYMYLRVFNSPAENLPVKGLITCKTIRPKCC